MPLIKSASKKAVSENIRELHTGKTYAKTSAKFGKKKANAQAVAIALDVARKARRSGGRAIPDAAIDIEQPNRRFLEKSEQGMESRQRMMPNGSTEDRTMYYFMNPKEDTNPYTSHLRERKLAAGGPTQQIPWTQRAAAQRLSFAGGMLNSPVPGRTDKLNLNVPAGSYVIPSSVVSFLGQDNSMAGAGVLDAMFSRGPAGSKMGGRRKFRSPKARMGKRSAKYGFQEGGDVEAQTEEVPIVAAGGEYLIPPDAIIEQFGDLDYGHKVLDQFVKEARQKHIATLKKLPGPER